jgi:hypothetical protein
MTWTNTNGETSADRPTRVRLPDFTTRTSEAITDEVLAEAGWSWVEPITEQVSVEVMTGVSGTASSNDDYR